MTLFIAFTVLLVVLLVIRIIRTIGFLKQANEYPPGEEKRAASWNFFIHIIICLILMYGIFILGQRIYRMKRTQDFYERIDGRQRKSL